MYKCVLVVLVGIFWLISAVIIPALIISVTIIAATLVVWTFNVKQIWGIALGVGWILWIYIGAKQTFTTS